MMMKDIVIEQKGKVLDSEIEELRSSVGWDNNTGPFSVISTRLYTYFTARKDGKLIGFIDVLSDGIADAYLQDLAIHPDFQRKGIGTELVKNTIRFLQKNNIKCIQVTFNPEHENFFKRFGFHIYKAGVIDRDTIQIKV